MPYFLSMPNSYVQYPMYALFDFKCHIYAYILSIYAISMPIAVFMPYVLSMTYALSLPYAISKPFAISMPYALCTPNALSMSYALSVQYLIFTSNIMWFGITRKLHGSPPPLTVTRQVLFN
jgi:hypothetical protein